MPSKSIWIRSQGELEEATRYFQQYKGGLVKLTFSQSSKNASIREGGITAFLDALETTEAGVQFLTINPSVFDHLNESTEDRFYSCLGASLAPSLKVIHWTEGGPFPEFERRSCLRRLFQLLVQARSLKELKCEEAKFFGDLEDFQNFANCLQSHPTLTTLLFPNVRVLCSLDETYKIAPVLAAISSIPNLTKLDIVHWACQAESTEFINIFYSEAIGNALVQIYSHGNLTSLSIDQPQNDLGSHALSSAICQSRSLKRLSIRLFTKIEDCSLVSRVLRENTSLAKLKLLWKQKDGRGQPPSDPPASFEDFHLKETLSALQQNSTLTKLEIDYASSVDVANFRLGPEIGKNILSLLERNTTLTKFHFGLTRFGVDLRRFEECHWETPIVEGIKFYLGLNRAGRKLVENPNATRSQWVGTLEKAVADETCSDKLLVSILFFFLLENPSLCEIQSEAVRSCRSQAFDSQPSKKRKLEN